jgi:hypothetical protein
MRRVGMTRAERLHGAAHTVTPDLEQNSKLEDRASADKQRKRGRRAYHSGNTSITSGEWQ